MKLIDKKELKEWIESWLTNNKYYHPYSKSNSIPIDELYDILEQMPTIETEPIRHGKWIITECLGVKDMICPECGEMYDYNEGLEEDWKYCPNCGARNDGKGEQS